MMQGRIIRGDAFRVIPTLPDGCVRACVTSPPYAEQRKRQYVGVPESEYSEWTARWMRLLKPKLKADGSALIVLRAHVRDGQVLDYVLRTRLRLREEGWIEPGELVWLKPDAPPLGSVDRPRRTWENVLWFSKSRRPFVSLKTANRGFDGSGRYGAGGDSPVHGGQRRRVRGQMSRFPDHVLARIGETERGIRHPAMFPITLADKLILAFTQAGDLILDPFCGSGTTCRSARDLDRRFVGIEVVPKYAAMAKRLLRRGD